MNGSDNRQFLFKQVNNKMYNFYSDKNRILYRSKLSDRGWTNPAILAEECFQSFYVEMDKSNTFHIFLQDLSGNLYYYKLSNSIASKMPILKSTVTNAYERHLCVLTNTSSPIFIFTIQNTTGTSLVFQNLRNRNPSKPRSIDLIPENTCPYSIVNRHTSEPLIFYPVLRDTFVQIGFRKFLENQGISDIKIISSYSGNCEMPKCIDLPDKSLHLIYHARTSNGIELLYQNKPSGAQDFLPAVSLYTATHSLSHSSIIFSNNTLYVYWIRDGLVFYTVSNNFGKNFSNAQKLIISGIPRLNRATYHSNIDIEARCDDEPLYIGTSVQHAFYRESEKRLENSSQPFSPIYSCDSDIKKETISNTHFSESSEIINANPISENDYDGLRQHISRVDKDMQSISSNMLNITSKVRNIEDDILLLRDLASVLKETLEDFGGYIKDQGTKNIQEFKRQLKPSTLKSSSPYKIARDKE